MAIFPARCDLGHEANPKKPKSMKEPPDLTVRSDLNSARRADQNGSTGVGGATTGRQKGHRTD